MGKKIQHISSVLYRLDEEFNLKKLIGKRVLAKDAEELGKVEDIIIKNYNIIGITFSKIMGPRLFVDRSHIASFTPDAVILNIKPFTSLVGLEVLDKNGRIIGKVKKVLRNDTSNNFKEFIVKTGLFKKITFKFADIDKISDKLILNKEYKE